MLVCLFLTLTSFLVSRHPGWRSSSQPRLPRQQQWQRRIKFIPPMVPAPLIRGAVPLCSSRCTVDKDITCGVSPDAMRILWTRMRHSYGQYDGPFGYVLAFSRPLIRTVRRMMHAPRCRRGSYARTVPCDGWASCKVVTCTGAQHSLGIPSEHTRPLTQGAASLMEVAANKRFDTGE